MSHLNEILKDIDYSSVKGNDKISNSLIKNYISIISKNLILHLFNSIFISSLIPSTLNISIIKPILKDYNKNSNELGNIRPISISNCFAQMFEKLILICSP